MLKENEYLLEVFKGISEQQNADIIIFNSGIDHSNFKRVRNCVWSISRKKPNVAFFLTTYGGDPDSAFRIIKFLKSEYKRVIVYVVGFCKSAGTLIACGADEIAMSRYGEFGPLDIQINKRDEFDRESGLVYYQATMSLKTTAFQIFEDYFLKLISKGGGIITTRTAAKIATELTTGIIQPLANQIDPLRVGEVERALNIILSYGERLPSNKEAITRLATEYPSHTFVIGFEEAKELFENVRSLNELEEKLELLPDNFLREPGDLDLIECVAKKIEGVGDENNEITAGCQCDRKDYGQPTEENRTSDPENVQ